MATPARPNQEFNPGAVINWSRIEGPGAFGTWGSIGFGLLDSVTFGMAYGDDVRSQTNGGYFVGMGLGIAVQIATGAWAANALRGVAGARAALGAWSTLNGTQRAALAYTGYALLGDAIGVGQSGAAAVNSYYTGASFNPLNLLGFAPTIGWAGSAYRGARRWSRGTVGLESRLLDEGFINQFVRGTVTPEQLKRVRDIADHIVDGNGRRLAILTGQRVNGFKCSRFEVLLRSVDDQVARGTLAEELQHVMDSMTGLYDDGRRAIGLPNVKKVYGVHYNAVWHAQTFERIADSLANDPNSIHRLFLSLDDAGRFRNAANDIWKQLEAFGVRR